MPRSITVVLLVVLLGSYLKAQSIQTIEWQTQLAAMPPQLNDDQKKLLPFIQLSSLMFREGDLVNMSGVSAAMFGVETSRADQLRDQLVNYYQKMDEDPLFKGTSSALPYCFSTTQPTKGLAKMYLPSEIKPETKIILFLHGFGGSFQFYHHFLVTCFPNDIIMCPAYGYSMANVPFAYLDECLNEAKKSWPKALANTKPYLIGLSAGGFGGFRVFERHSDQFKGFICLAAYPPPDARQPINGHIRILAGGNEPFVGDGTLAAGMKRIANNKIKSQLIPEADHFFLLSHEEESREILRTWINK